MQKGEKRSKVNIRINIRIPAGILSLWNTEDRRNDMKISLVIMAAGLGSRYGGSKQVDGVGPHNEILMEYGIYDALQAGFNKIVFIIKPDMVELMDRLCGGYLRQKTARDGSAVEVEYVFQDFSSIPAFYQIPEGRTKPFGTVHALLCAKDVVQEPCCVINADDYYGADAYQMMYNALLALPEEGQAVMVGYHLRNTASLSGGVTRGLCGEKDGWLRSVDETRNIQLYPDGTLRVLDTDRELDGDTLVSMNFWGYSPSIFPVLERYFEEFLRTEAVENEKAECLLPIMVDALMKRGQLRVSVLRSVDRWFGMTYQAERAEVAENLRDLHARGVYPPTLQ